MTSSQQNIQQNTQRDYVLYGAEVSLYSGKARAYLRYKNIPLQERLATLDVYREVIVPNIGRRVMPVVRWKARGAIARSSPIRSGCSSDRFSSSSSSITPCAHRWNPCCGRWADCRLSPRQYPLPWSS